MILDMMEVRSTTGSYQFIQATRLIALWAVVQTLKLEGQSNVMTEWIMGRVALLVVQE